MITDMWTVMWKDSKGLLRHSGNRLRAVFTLVVPIALFGVVFPIQFQDEWLTSGWSVMVSVITPLMLIGTTIAESFAGERERHTLETLLASRLPDRAILFGKLLLSIAFGWGVTLIILLVSLVVVNIMHWNGQIQIFQSGILWANISVSILMSGLVASLGVLISLRSETVQSAAQTTMMLLFLPLLLLQVVAFLLPSLLPEDTIRAFLDTLDYQEILLIFLAVLILADIGLFLGALMRFQRSKLTLS